MLQTEEQRRWWFATHPEFSRGHRGLRENSGKVRSESAIDPKEVDKYVDKGLKYEADTGVRALLKYLKMNFGTESYLSSEQKNLKGWEKILADGMEISPASNADVGLYISENPKMPTLDELARWPKQMIGRFFKWLDAIVQSNVLLIDPNKLERHHLLVRQFARYFMECGISAEDFVIIMRAADHRLKPDGVHTGKGRGGDWNREWADFINDWPKANNSKAHQDRIRAKLEDMKKRYQIDEKTILSPE